MQFHVGPLIQNLAEARMPFVADGRLVLFAGELSRLRAEIILCVSARGSGSREGLVNHRATYDGVVPTIIVRRADRQPDAAIVGGLEEERLYRLPGHIMSLMALGQTDAALQAYDAALRIDPGIAAVHFNRGVLLQSLNDIKRSRSAYERAAALNPNYAEPLASLAWLDARAGDGASARAHGERALLLSPTNVLARIALASAYLQQGELADAAASLSALSQDPSLTPINKSIALGLIGDLQDAEGRPAEAFAAYEASNLQMKALYAGQFEAQGKETALGHG